MSEPIRVLVIEDRKSERFIAQQLLGSYDVDFTWRHVASESELRTVAKAFDPNLVFSADDLTPGSRSGALDLLRLLTLQAVVVHVAEVDEMDASALCDAAASDWQPVHPSGAPAARHVTVVDAIEEAAAPAPTPAAHWPKSLPSLLHTSDEVVAMSDSAGWITYANANTSRLFSEPREQAIGTVLGLAYDFAAPVPGPHRLGLFDALTGLPKPVHLSDLFACMMSRSQGSRTAVPIVALDLQGLRTMNELCGPAMSDEVLNVVGSELRFGGAAGCGMIARVGEDDILLVLPEPSDPADAAVNVRGNRRSAGAIEAWADDSAMASSPEMASLPEMARPSAIASPPPMARADAGAQLPSINTAPAAESRLPVEEGLDDALRRHAIGVHYQPQFELQSGRGCGVEALARWSLASGKVVSPAIFIPVAERAGMIDALGADVLLSACDTVAAWRGRDAERLTVSVNVSTLQINEKFSKVLGKILETSGLEPGRLELEIAEAAVIGNSELISQTLKQWKQLGARVAVNHAGTNYSSLSYLSRLPIDRLKLDKSLIHSTTLDSKAAGVIHAMISLGAALGIDVIAEGVETEPQFKTLLELGCRQIQGYLLGRPMLAVQAQVALRKPWGNLPKEVLRPRSVISEKYAS
jgi:EAL domain-containing protein (putative c-di-GMP-specific phosphodiesterase class I)/GGDEF domain-containing protein